MSGRIVRDNIDGSITTVDDGVERTWNAEAWRTYSSTRSKSSSIGSTFVYWNAAA